VIPLTNEQKQPEKVPTTFIKCKCGNNLFMQAKMLGPGDNRPAVIKQVWVCIGCGMRYETDDFPKKGEEETRRESKIITPDRMTVRQLTS